MTRNGIEDVPKTMIEAYRTIEMVGMAKVVGKKNETEAANDAKIDMMSASDTTGNFRIHIQFGQFGERVVLTFDFCLSSFSDTMMTIDTANVMSNLIEAMLETRAIIVQVRHHRTVQVPFEELRP